MISPHPSTTQIVAEDARKERLATLTVQRRQPGLIGRIWQHASGFVAAAGILGGRFLARIRRRESSHPQAHDQTLPGASRLAGDRLEAPLLIEQRARVPKIQPCCQQDDSECHGRVTRVREHQVSQTDERLPDEGSRRRATAN